MTEGFDLKIERRLSAPPSEVFRCWTEPNELMRWFKPSGEWSTTKAEVDLRVGGSYRIAFSSPAGNEYVESGEYLEILPDTRLSYSGEFRGPTQHFKTVVNVEFFEDGDGTRLVIVERGYPSEEVRNLHQAGWGGFLDQLEKVAVRT